MDRLRNLRKNFKKTQQQVASLLGITQQAYAAYENDVSHPPKDVLEKLADYFDVSVDYLLGREEKSPPAQQESLNIPDALKPYQFAFYEGIDGLSEESIKDILKYVDYVKSKENKEKK